MCSWFDSHAMTTVSFQLQGLDQLQKMQAFLNLKTFAKAQRAGIAKATSSIKTQVAKGITQAYGIKSARIKNDISNAAIAPDGGSALVRFSRWAPTLTQYGARPGRQGKRKGLGRGMGWAPPKRPGQPLSVLVLRSGGRKPVRDAFMAQGRGGNQLVLRRGKGGKLKALHGPSVGSIFLGKSRIADSLQRTVSANIERDFMKGFERKMRDISKGYG